LLQIFFVFITKQASLVQNRPRNHANVNDPLVAGFKSWVKNKKMLEIL